MRRGAALAAALALAAAQGGGGERPGPYVPYSGGAPPLRVYPGSFASPEEAEWVTLKGPTEVPPFWTGGADSQGMYGVQSGPYRVTNETVYNGRGPPTWDGNLGGVPDLLLREYTSTVYTPISDDVNSSDAKWPMLIYGHGMCGPAYYYAEAMVLLASYGYVVMSDDAQGDCGGFNTEALLSSGLGAISSLPYATNISMAVTNMYGELDYLQSREDVEKESLYLMGHSMGGSAVIVFADFLEESNPGLLKGVVAVSPWNFARHPDPLPSDAVANISAPVMVLCSTTDQMAPCEGYAFSSYTPPMIQGLIQLLLPITFGGNQTFLGTSFSDPRFNENFAWDGGVEAIFKNASDAVQIQIPGMGHTTTSGVNNGSDAYEAGVVGIEHMPFLPFANGDTINYTTNFPTGYYATNFLNILSGSELRVPGYPAPLGDSPEQDLSLEELLRQGEKDWRTYKVATNRNGKVRTRSTNETYASCLQGKYCGDEKTYTTLVERAREWYCYIIEESAVPAAEEAEVCA